MHLLNNLINDDEPNITKLSSSKYLYEIYFVPDVDLRLFDEFLFSLFLSAIWFYGSLVRKHLLDWTKFVNCHFSILLFTFIAKWVNEWVFFSGFDRCKSEDAGKIYENHSFQYTQHTTPPRVKTQINTSCLNDFV